MPRSISLSYYECIILFSGVMLRGIVDAGTGRMGVSEARKAETLAEPELLWVWASTRPRRGFSPLSPP